MKLSRPGSGAASAAQSDPALSSLPRALSDIDRRGRLTPSSARVARATLERLRAEGRSFASFEPEDLLGPFGELSAPARAAIVRALERAERWRLNARAVERWRPELVRALSSPRVPKPALKAASLLKAAVGRGPTRFVAAAAHVASAFQARAARRPSLGALLEAGGFHPWLLSVCYARGMRQPRGYEGFWHDERRRVTVGSVIGLDLIRNAEGFWFVESNLDTGLVAERTAIWEHDPMASNLVAFARESGYRRIVMIVPNIGGIDRDLAVQLEEAARAGGVDLAVWEDVFRHEAEYPRRDPVPDLESLDTETLVIRMRWYDTNLDRVLNHKTAAYRALRLFQERTGEAGFRLPETMPDPPRRLDRGDPRLPNLVYKLPWLDSGAGVFFLKATSADHARALAAEALRSIRPRGFIRRVAGALGEHGDIYQRFISSSLLDGRLSFIRVNVLITPLAERFLAAHRVVSRCSAEHELPGGLVRDPRPFLVKRGIGTIGALPPEEEVGTAEAALAIARGFSWAAAYGFTVAPGYATNAPTGAGGRCATSAESFQNESP